ncbi:MAG: crotonobetainyl-CoA:carnitine CoA-transferase CaiB-like acyl-CoA transferase [Gammaproteobacteria bacterium]|jgi:crotonobetainyl-CoA:carnitine CoA-transferase CaiB-like acyl-CoA transferase
MSSNEKDIPQQLTTALTGVRVLDLGRVLAAPFAAQVLGDLGAEFIKIERPDGGDDTRPWKPPETGGNSAYFASINRNKRSVTLDFGSDEGREVFYELVRKSDVVIQNFRPGVTERLGIDYDSLKAIRPELIYCSISGFGQQGPLASRAAYDYIVQAFSGVMSLTGEVDGDPVRCAGAISDYGSGIWAVVSILFALMERDRMGRGQHIDLSMLDCTLPYISHLIGNYLAAGIDPPRLGNGHTSIVPMDVYQTQDRPLMVMCGNDGMFRRMMTALGAPELGEDPRYALNVNRAKNLPELQEWIRERFKTDNQEGWLKRLSDADVPVAPVRSVAETMNSDEIRDRQMILELEDPNGEPVRLLGSPLKFSESSVAQNVKLPPRLAEHSREVLAELAGVDEQRLQQLVERGVTSVE